MKIRTVGAELIHTDGQPEKTKIIALRKFANAPQKVQNNIRIIWQVTTCRFVQRNKRYGERETCCLLF